MKLEAFTAKELEKEEFPPLFEPIPGLLCEGVHILAGRPKSGKSWLILQMALAVAGGQTALERFEVPKPIGVVYMALEDGARRLQRRLGKLRVEGWPEWLIFRTVDIPGTMAAKIREVERLLDGFEADEPAVLFVDTWGRFRPEKKGKDAYQDDYKPMSDLAAIVQKRSQLTIVVVHHTKKLGDDGRDLEPLEAVSGTYGLAGAADSIMVLNRKTGSRQGTLTMTGRDSDEKSFLLTRIEDGDGWKCIGEGAAHLKPEEMAIIGAIVDLGGVAGPSAVAARLRVDVETVKKRMQRMANVEPASLERRGRGQYVVV